MGRFNALHGHFLQSCVWHCFHSSWYEGLLVYMAFISNTVSKRATFIHWFKSLKMDKTDVWLFLEQHDGWQQDLYLILQRTVWSLSWATVHCLVTETTILKLSHTPLLRSAVEWWISILLLCVSELLLFGASFQSHFSSASSRYAAGKWTLVVQGSSYNVQTSEQLWMQDNDFNCIKYMYMWSSM